MKLSDSSARRRLGVLMLWAVLPLPFTLMILPPFYFAVIAAALFMILVPTSSLKLSFTLKNVAGVLIVLAVLAAGGLRVGPLRPLGHLLLLLLAIRGLMAGTRKETQQVLPQLGVVWIVSIASSTHLLLFAYLVASAVVGWWLGMRLLLESLSPGGIARSGVIFPRLKHAAIAGIVAFLIGLPIFVSMPRLRSPWIAGLAGARGVSGFSSAIELASVGEIQESKDIAIVVRSSDGSQLDPEWLRLRATAFDLQRTGVWSARSNEFEVLPRIDGRYWLDPSRTDLRGCTELEIDMLSAERFLFVPYGTVAIQAPRRVGVDSAGGVVTGWRRRVLSYKVWVPSEPVPLKDQPTVADLHVPRPRPEITELARTTTGESPAPDHAAVTLQNYLKDNFEYSLTNEARFSPDPVAWFLLEGKKGHCEFFAGSMVIMLRMLEIPARMVGGYYGGTVMGRGSEVFVRQSNAHAWVEVWLGADRGWVVYDPTPSAGIPILGTVSGLNRLRWAWDWLVVNWDRWVVGFGLSQQVILVSETMELIDLAVQGFRWSHGVWAAFILGGAAATFLGRRRLAKFFTNQKGLRRLPASTELTRVVTMLEKAGETIRPGETWRRIGRRARSKWPQATAPLDQLVRLAEHELYGERALAADHRDQTRQARVAWRSALD
ncbi:MAG: DUF3488 domain-containing protein [bacterium]|nr:DUF3488 domain-containing protein [bacterium]